MSEPSPIDDDIGDAIDDDSDPRLPELLPWRQRLIASGAVSAHTFKEAHLRMVLRSGRTDAEQIRMMLPDPVSEHADEMARALSAVPGLGARGMPAKSISRQPNSPRSSSPSRTATRNRSGCAANTVAR